MVRIISGECKGRKLSSLKGTRVRPTSDRAKETLFNIIADRIPGCSFLDLFAGTGSVGLEAASRGADHVVMVESDRRVLKVLEENIEKCGLGGKVRVLLRDSGICLRVLSSEQLRFDLIFMDPPYRDRGAYGLVQQIEKGGLLKTGGWVIAEHDRRLELPPAYECLVVIRRKRVGDTVFSFYGGSFEE